MEFLLNADSNSMKRIWLQHGFKDESPIWGSQSIVPTFKNQRSVIEQWPDFQWQMQEVDADWYYLSGHHGRRRSADREGVDAPTHANTQQDVGFFNAHYHHGTWEGHAAKELEVYMSTSTGPWDVYEHGPRDNPLHGQPHTKCKGLMLVGCNTLLYLSVRRMLLKYFPNAVIMGLMSTENSAITKILRTVRKHGRGFFVNPKSIEAVDLCQQLNPTVGRVDRMGVISDGVLFFPTYGQIVMHSAEEPLDPGYF
jgi:hypothetical protein